MYLKLLRMFLDKKTQSYDFYKYDQKESSKKIAGLKDAGLYIHVPFCRKLCDFCPYYKVKFEKDLANRYVNALLLELEVVKKKYEVANITSVYYGGGTPALISDRLSEINTKIIELFNFKGEFAIELHPENLKEEIIDDLVGHAKENSKYTGFSKISVGIQSFNERLLKNLGRNSEKNFYGELGILNRNGQSLFSTIDIDLIFGIPGQKKEDLRNDFIRAVEAGATQISTYPFIDFSYTDVKYKPAGRNEKKKLLKTLLETSEEMGFKRDSVWTFKRPETNKYSSVTRNFFIGLGPSAVTLTLDNFFINTFSVEDYCEMLETKKSAIALKLDFTRRSRMVYWLFWSCYERQIDAKKFHDIFDAELESEMGFWLKTAKTFRFIKKTDNNTYKLTDKASYYYHLVEQELTHAYIDRTWKECAKNVWPDGFSI